jgi:hypothetical protein
VLSPKDSTRLNNLARAAAQQPVARPMKNYGTGTATTPSTPGGAFVPGVGLRRVTHSNAYPSASHQPMQYQPNQ